LKLISARALVEFANRYLKRNALNCIVDAVFFELFRLNATNLVSMITPVAMSDYPRLADLAFLPYINAEGQLPEQFQAQVGVYGVFDQAQTLQYIGYSRDVSLSLRQHLVRQPDRCYWVKVTTIDKPSRTALEAQKEAWIGENGSVPIGNAPEATGWIEPIPVKARMTAAEATAYGNPNLEEVDQVKILKNIARRVEADILEVLKARGLQATLRFNPKLKEEGLLDLK
jgi:hypothetical protein